MREHTHSYLTQLNKSNALRGNVRRIIGILSFVVVLSVFWGLKLTGITLAGEAFCGMDEHVHGDRCPQTQLICTREEEPAHVHSEACILRELVCGLEEVSAHTHDDSCLKRELVCGLEEVSAHTHDDSCRGKTLQCEREENHSHSVECYEEVLACPIEDETHQHNEACYQQKLLCGIEEDHTHDESCYILGEAYVCGREETPGHIHEDACFISVEGSHTGPHPHRGMF